jgi:HAD superfamily hydrolase (TIGR01490 family)
VTRAAAFFDLDKTVIAKSSAMAFTKQFQAGGLLSRTTLIRSAYSHFLYLMNGADLEQIQKMRQFMSLLVVGWDVDQVRSIVADTLHHTVDPLVYAEALNLIHEHQAAGRDVVIVSASGSEVVGPIGELLGVDHVIASRLEEKDGKYTGEFEFWAYGPTKAEAMHELAHQYGYDLSASYAYSDSATDEPMLSAVGHPFAVNPDKDLRRIALERDWPTLVFTRPVRLRDHLPSNRALAGLVIGAAAAGVTLWWAGRRSHKDT